jgi:hypothetical protein
MRCRGACVHCRGSVAECVRVEALVAAGAGARAVHVQARARARAARADTPRHTHTHTHTRARALAERHTQTHPDTPRHTQTHPGTRAPQHAHLKCERTSAITRALRPSRLSEGRCSNICALPRLLVMMMTQFLNDTVWPCQCGGVSGARAWRVRGVRGVRGVCEQRHRGTQAVRPASGHTPGTCGSLLQRRRHSEVAQVALGAS